MRKILFFALMSLMASVQATNQVTVTASFTPSTVTEGETTTFNWSSTNAFGNYSASCYMYMYP